MPGKHSLLALLSLDWHKNLYPPSTHNALPSRIALGIANMEHRQARRFSCFNYATNSSDVHGTNRPLFLC